VTIAITTCLVAEKPPISSRRKIIILTLKTKLSQERSSASFFEEINPLKGGYFLRICKNTK
jgi:hypothetical protein